MAASFFICLDAIKASVNDTVIKPVMAAAIIKSGECRFFTAKNITTIPSNTE